MEKNTLGEVIEAERKIRARLDEEKLEAEQHLQEVTEQAAQEVEDAKTKLKDVLNGAIREAEVKAHEKAEDIRRAALEQDRRLKTLDEATLKHLVLKHIAAILPETP